MRGQPGYEQQDERAEVLQGHAQEDGALCQVAGRAREGRGMPGNEAGIAGEDQIVGDSRSVA